MPVTKTCSQCGMEIPIDALMGLCPACLFDYATRPVESAPTLAGNSFGESGRRFADYALGRQLGRGGMGVVYEAVQTSLHRPVALKMILDAEASSPTARRRFTLEAETAASLTHDQFHTQERLALMLTNFVNGDDVRMVEAGGGFRFAHESLHLGLAGEQAGQQHLERDGTVEADLPGAIDNAHAAAGEFAEQFVVAER